MPRVLSAFLTEYSNNFGSQVNRRRANWAGTRTHFWRPALVPSLKPINFPLIRPEPRNLPYHQILYRFFHPRQLIFRRFSSAPTLWLEGVMMAAQWLMARRTLAWPGADPTLPSSRPHPTRGQLGFKGPWVPQWFPTQIWLPTILLVNPDNSCLAIQNCTWSQKHEDQSDCL